MSARRVATLRSAHGLWKTTTIGANLRRTGIVAPIARYGLIDCDAFITRVREVLVPDLLPGDIVIMDNLSSHKMPVVREAIEAAGARLLFLPPLRARLQPGRAGLLQTQNATT